jgi:hypothetical protein
MHISYVIFLTNTTFCGDFQGSEDTESSSLQIEVKPKKMQSRHGIRKSNTGIRAVKSAQYLDKLSPTVDDYPKPGCWKPTMEHGRKYYRLLCRDYEIAAGEISVPNEADVYWGTGEEKLVLPEYAGDICPGIDFVTPVAQKKFTPFGLSTTVSFNLGRAPGSNRGGILVTGTHWGNGIVLRDEERDTLRDELTQVFETEEKEITGGVLAHLLRAFWPGRTYVRTFKFCGKKGKKLSSFHLKRIEAVFSKFLF